jgi:hypothetical protein
MNRAEGISKKAVRAHRGDDCTEKPRAPGRALWVPCLDEVAQLHICMLVKGV